MKKRNSTPEPDVVDPKIAAQAKRIVFEPKARKTYECRVCGDPTATDESEGLCWVCRRLKISAWREIESQLPLSE
jgi:rubrerythrin